MFPGGIAIENPLHLQYLPQPTCDIDPLAQLPFFFATDRGPLREEPGLSFLLRARVAARQDLPRVLDGVEMRFH